MVLLDQDTVVTREYLDEVVAVASGEEAVPPSVAVLVPRLVDAGRLLSPHGRVRLRPRRLSNGPGVVLGFSTHLNSGSVLRLSAVRRVGGFPDGYPLDYLDHAVASRLREAGGLTWLLRSTLEHRLSLLDRRSTRHGPTRLDPRGRAPVPRRVRDPRGPRLARRPHVGRRGAVDDPPPTFS